MKRILSFILAAVICFPLFSPCISAYNSSVETLVIDVISSECSYTTSTVFVKDKRCYMSVEDIARYTRSELEKENDEIIITHGVREIFLDFNPGILTEKGIIQKINTIEIDGMVYVHAYPLLTYLGAECGVYGNRLTISMPKVTMWEAFSLTGHENDSSIDIFGSETEVGVRLVLDYILRILDDGLTSVFTTDIELEALVMAMSVDLSNYNGAFLAKSEIDLRYKSLFEDMILFNDFLNLDDPLFQDSASVVEPFVSNYFDEYFKDYGDECNSLIGILSDVDILTNILSSISDNRKLCEDTVDMMKAFRANLSESNSFYDDVRQIENKASSEFSSMLDSTLSAFTSKIIDKASDGDFGGGAGFSQWNLLNISLDISVLLNKTFFGTEQFEYSRAEMSAITLLSLKDTLIDSINNLADKIVDENYSDANNLNTARLLRILYYRTLIAINEQLIKLIEVQNKELLLKEFYDSLKSNSEMFAERIYLLSVCKVEALPDLDDGISSNPLDTWIIEYENEEGSGTNTTDLAVTDAVKYEKSVLGKYSELISNAKHSVVLPKLTSGTIAATAFNKKIIENHGDYLDLLKQDKEDAVIYEANYVYTNYNGIIGIIIEDTRQAIGSYTNKKYFGYYFDTNTDKELNFLSYIEAVGVDYSDIAKEANKVVNDYYMDPAKRISTDINDFEIPGAIFDSNSTYIILPPDGWGQFLVEFSPMNLNYSNESYSYVGILEKFLEKNKSLIESLDDYGKINNAFVADLDNDGIPELCIDCEQIHGGKIVVFKIDNGVVETEAPISGEYGTGISADIYFLVNSEGKLTVEQVVCSAAWDSVFYEFYKYEWTDKELICIDELYMYSSESDSYGYKESVDTQYTEVGETAFNSIFDDRMSEIEKNLIDYKTCDFEEIWEMQKMNQKE